MYAMDHKQIAIQLLSTIVIQTFNTTVIIPAKVIVAQTQIQEDAADIEDNLVSILKAYSTFLVL